MTIRSVKALIAPAAVSALLFGANVTFPSSSELVKFAEQGNRAAVGSLLKSGDIPVNEPSRDGMTALLWAAQANDLPMVKSLLEAGADPNFGNRYHITPLWLAALNRSPEMIELLIQRGASAAASLPHGETPLMVAARAGDPESIDLLLAAGADPNASESLHGETALMWAAAEDHPDAIRALVAGGADLDRHSRALNLAPMKWESPAMTLTSVLPVGGWTAAMYAARQNSAEAMEALIALGSSLDEQDENGTTALSLAIMNEHYDLAAALLEAGADPNVADHAGASALYVAVDMVSRRGDVGRPPRPLFDELNAIDIVRLVLTHGANPNARLLSRVIDRHHERGDPELAEGATTLMKAAKAGDLESMRVLLEAGADPALELASGLTVFDLAEGKGRGDANEEVQNLLQEFAGHSR
ncbi:MAG TPA: ankyrin repeat domain-containing protein [Hyphomicrobiales bacterium]|nr:ankyrin repeat domain-containing protein [Hyphomicrobiales bacterium]